MEEKTTVTPAPVATPAVAPAKKSKSILWILLALLVLCVGCCACSFFYVTTNQEIQDSFKEGFCQSYTQNGSPEGSDPFGWCE